MIYIYYYMNDILYSVTSTNKLIVSSDIILCTLNAHQ